MKPRIGIVGRCQNNDGYTFVGVIDTLRIAILECGGIPILILPTQKIEYDRCLPTDVSNMNSEEREDLIKQIKLCDGIIMPGGNKIFEYDTFISEYVKKEDINVLGICLGMQIMSLTNYIDNLNIVNNHNKKDKYVHMIKTKENSILREVLGEYLSVNSRHKECIKDNNDYNITAISNDGIIEGLEYPFNKFNVGVQWHPESMIYYDKKQYNLIKLFIEKCKNKS